jgi:hypothetical protein
MRPIHLCPTAGGVPVMGTSRAPGKTDRPRSYPSKPEGVAGLPRWTTKATLATTLASTVRFFALGQKILWYSLNTPGTRYRDTTAFSVDSHDTFVEYACYLDAR